MRKTITLLLIAALLAGGLSACGAQPADTAADDRETDQGAPEEKAPETQPEDGGQDAPEEAGQDAISVGVLGGNTGVSAAWLMEQAELGQTDDPYTFETATAPDEMVALLMSGQVQIAALPTNVAANLYHKSGGQFQMAAICAYGVLHVLENGDTVETVSDLAGRTIHTTGQGANPEYILNYVLEQNGLTPGVDVTVEFHDNEALTGLMAAGEIDLCMMPEPMVTTVLSKNPDVRAALDMTEQWDTVSTDGRLMMSCIVVERAFAAENPGAVDRFLDVYSRSVSETNANPDQVAPLVEKFGIIPNAAVAERAIPGCNLTFLAGPEMETAIAGYYGVLFDANPEAVGGAIPDGAFYYVGE